MQIQRILIIPQGGHPTSSTLISAVHTQSAQYFHPLFTLFFFFLNPSYRAHLQPSFPCAARPFTAEFCVIPFHRAHHGNLVRPGKNAPQHNNKAVFFPLQKGPKASGAFLFSSSPSLAWQSTSLGLCGRNRRFLQTRGDKSG